LKSVAPSIGDESLVNEHGPHRKGKGLTHGEEAEGPDPIVGAGITLLGIFLMGTGGARDAHYVFDLGVATAVLGAGVFVLCVALSAMKQRRANAAPPAKLGDEPPASA